MRGLRVIIEQSRIYIKTFPDNIEVSISEIFTADKRSPIQRVGRARAGIVRDAGGEDPRAPEECRSFLYEV